MTDAGWAEKKVNKAWHSHRGGLTDYASKLLRKEHARSVRIVKRFIKRAQDTYRQADKNENPSFTHHEVHVFIEQVCWEIHDALQRGRGGKG